MKLKSGDDEINLPYSLSELKEIPVGKCMNEKLSMNIDGEALAIEVSICRVDKQRWKIEGKSGFEDDEYDKFSFDGEISIEDEK